MSDQTDRFSQLLQPYGLSMEEAMVYAFLSQKGYQSALSISRENHLGRTKVYRLLDNLIAKKLIEQKLDDRGLKFGATDPSKFEQLVIEKEHAAAALRESLPALVETLQSMAPQQGKKSKILYYEGVEGYKQITYNSTKAKGMMRIIEQVDDVGEYWPKDFTEYVARKFMENQVKIHQITPFTKLSPWIDMPGYIDQCHSIRYISPKKLHIDFEVLVYNDVYALYSVGDEDAVCVEIYNEQLAQMQKQIFDFLWDSAQEMEIDEHGAGRLIV
jgi:predicted transcriptional regulator